MELGGEAGLEDNRDSELNEHSQNNGAGLILTNSGESGLGVTHNIHS